MTSLYIQDSNDSYRPASSEQILLAAQSLLRQRLRPGAPVLERSETVRQFLTYRYGALDYEVFAVLLLDTRDRLICLEDIFRGSICGVVVPIAEVVKIALRHCAMSAICVHCHPSGIAEPSACDRKSSLPDFAMHYR